MKTKGFTMTTVIIIIMGIICAAVCSRQTAYLISFQDVFTAEHPSYVSHSCFLLTLLLVMLALACGQVVLSRRRNPTPGSTAVCCSASVLMIVLEVLALRAAADQHYHMGMLISDYGIRLSFDGGWLQMFLVLALIVATVTQFLIALYFAFSKHTEKKKDLDISEGSS